MDCKSIGLNKRMKFLFKYNIVSVYVARFSVMLKVLFYHLIRYIPCAPYTITYSPKMSPPITLRQIGIFFLKSSRCATFQSLYNITHRFNWRILYVDMDMVSTNYSFQNSNIFRIAYLFYQLSASFLYIALKNMISILSNPYNMYCQPRYAVAPLSLAFAHLSKVQKCVATESLALKAHSFN